MKGSVYTVKNEITGGFEGLFIYRNDAIAGRMLIDNIQKSHMTLDDIRLYRVGAFDMDSGSLTSHIAVEIPLVVNAPVESKMSPVKDSES